MASDLILIESHETNGVEWGISTDGPNPTPENYIKCRNEGHARYIVAQYNAGLMTPFLIAAGATQGTFGDGIAEARWIKANGYSV